MPIWKTHLSLKELQKRCDNTFVAYLGIAFTEVGNDFLKATLTLGPHLMQPLGSLHGGVSCVLAESVGTAAAYYCVDPNMYACVGLDINTNHIRPAKEGVLTATARPYHIGKSTQVWSIEIHDEKKLLISINRLTVANIRIKTDTCR
jgi:1,4-dihydroxy-2-naphthoyl-CoA hydrolase